MGVTFVAVRVYRDRGPASVVRFLVDSGATYTVLPWRTWRRLGLRPRRTIELTLADGMVEPAIEAIVRAARTGKIGDGKIFVTAVEQVIRIRTGESGEAAV